MIETIKIRIDKKMRIYISGMMTGLENDNKDAFMEVERKLKKALPDAEIINPVSLGEQLEGKLGRKPTYIEYLYYDLGYVSICDTIFMMDNWRASNGARKEFMLAESLGLNIIYEEDLIEQRDN